MKLTFNGESPTVYSNVKCADGTTLLAIPGGSYDVDSNPDENLFSVGSAPAVSLTPVELPSESPGGDVESPSSTLAPGTSETPEQ